MPRWGDVLGTLGAAFGGYDVARKNIDARDEQQRALMRQSMLDQRAAATEARQTAQWDKTYGDTHARTEQDLAASRQGMADRAEEKRLADAQRLRDTQIDIEVNKPESIALVKRARAGDITAATQYHNLVRGHSRYTDYVKDVPMPEDIGRMKSEAVAKQGVQPTVEVMAPGPDKTQGMLVPRDQAGGRLTPQTATGATATRATATAKEKIASGEAGLLKIQRAVNAVKANPAAFGSLFQSGLSTVGEGTGLTAAAARFGLREGRQRLQPQYNEVRTQIANLANAIIHDLSGAAVTPQEYQRIREGTPDLNGDTTDKLLTKLQLLQQAATDILSARRSEFGIGAPIAAAATPNLGGLDAEIDAEVARRRAGSPR